MVVLTLRYVVSLIIRMWKQLRETHLIKVAILFCFSVEDPWACGQTDWASWGQKRRRRSLWEVRTNHLYPKSCNDICRRGAKLFKFSRQSRSWEKLGMGQVSLLSGREWSWVRLVITRTGDQGVFADYSSERLFHFNLSKMIWWASKVTPDMQLEPSTNSDRDRSWLFKTSATADTLAIRFANTKGQCKAALCGSVVSDDLRDQMLQISRECLKIVRRILPILWLFVLRMPRVSVKLYCVVRSFLTTYVIRCYGFQENVWRLSEE